MFDAPLSENGTPLLKARELNKNQKYFVFPPSCTNYKPKMGKWEYPDEFVAVSCLRYGNTNFWFVLQKKGEFVVLQSKFSV